MNASLMPMPKQAFFATVNGVHGPIVGGYVYFYESGTTTPKDAYTTAAGSTPTANPIRLNARGEPATGVFLGPGAYTVKLADANNAEVWTQDGVIASIPTELVFAGTYGAIGDGLANDTDAMQNALNAAVGKVLLLGPQKTYGITAITIPAGVTMLANGSTFKKLAASGTYGITVSGGLTCDRLVLVSPGSSTDNGIKIAGGNINVDYIEAGSTAVDSLFGLRVEDTTPATIKNVRIGTIKTTNYRSAVQFFNGQYFDIGRVNMTSYIIGLYVKDLKDSTVNAGNASTASPMAAGGAGENGLLIESTTDFASENLTFRGFHVADAPEHAFRIGSERPVRNIFYYGCSSTNSGSIGNTSTGGAAFKVLHDNTNATFHENINVIGFDAVDCSNSTGGLDNMAAFQIGKLKGGQFSNVTIRKRNNTYSCKFGFQVFASEDIEINNPNITDCMRHAFQFIQAAVVSPAYPTTMKRIHVNGGHAQVMESASTSAVARFTVADGTFTDVSIKGTTFSGGGLASLHDAPTGGGAYTDCNVDINYRDPLNIAGGPPVQNPNTILVNYKGPYYGTFGFNALNASIVQDTTNGLTRVRNGGVFETVGMSSGSYVPTMTLVTNVDAATVVGSFNWLRVGNIVSVSGIVNIDNTTANAASELGISLPIASAMTSTGQVAGNGAASSPSSLSGAVNADATNDRARLLWQAVGSTDSRAWGITFSYIVV